MSSFDQGMTQEQSRQLGQALMAFGALQALIFVLGVMRKSYFVIALPVSLIVAVTSGLAIWVGYTMSTKDWDDPADYP